MDRRTIEETYTSAEEDAELARVEGLFDARRPRIVVKLVRPPENLPGDAAALAHLDDLYGDLPF